MLRSFMSARIADPTRQWIMRNTAAAHGRIAMTRYMKRGGKVWINIFPDKPVTQKPAETRMGSGKGTPRSGSRWSSPAASCSSAGVPEDVAREAMRLAGHKLPIRTKFVTRAEQRGGVNEGYRGENC